MKNPDELHRILIAGSMHAEEVAEKTLKRLQNAIGLLSRRQS